jgi:HEAT repeat protein
VHNAPVPLDLNSIDWASLTHAYGSAADVPGLLRDLRSDDSEVRDAASYELYGNIHHQGTRYEASAYAVPFLLELVADPTTPGRHEIIQLLSCLATGYSPYDIPAAGFPIAELRRKLAQVPAESWAAWSQAMADWHQVVRTGQKQPLPLGKAERRLLDLRHAIAAYDAVRAGVPLLLSCLDDPDPEVVGEAIHALAWFPEEEASIGPRLLDIADATAGTLIALGALGGTPTRRVTDLLRRNLESEDRDLRWAAAVAWTQLAGEGAPDAAIAELRSWAARSEQDTEETVWGASPSDVALEVLDEFAAPVAQEVRAGLVAEVLAEQPTSNWHNHFNVVLAYAFPDMEPDHGHGFADLTAAQRAAITWLTDHPQVFGSSGPQGPLRQYGLPTTHEELSAYARA